MIYKDYGIAYSQLNRAAARQQGLKYFNERWVEPRECWALRKQRAVIAGILGLFVLSVVSTGIVALFALLLIPLGIAASPMDRRADAMISAAIVYWMFGLLCSTGVTVLWYFAMHWNQICRWILVGLGGLGELFLIVFAVGAIAHSPAPEVVTLLVLIPIVIQGLVIWLLVCPTASSLYRFNQGH